MSLLAGARRLPSLLQRSLLQPLAFSNGHLLRGKRTRAMALQGIGADIVSAGDVVLRTVSCRRLPPPPPPPASSRRTARPAAAAIAAGGAGRALLHAGIARAERLGANNDRHDAGGTRRGPRRTADRRAAQGAAAALCVCVAGWRDGRRDGRRVAGPRWQCWARLASQTWALCIWRHPTPPRPTPPHHLNFPLRPPCR